ncbi:MAG: hypothetical protein DI556_06090 [Rhodovulum sulfidophilum]|uniref:Alginate export domain-containing protein n=1 Tax=Rhodovulum sulfidophilum TaxID=35806 RepID=A0A2W5Q0D4_RHOSU|nr:MAG: hypothetical protein DI556_06090 [Rhodovulum sulfidophilum]
MLRLASGTLATLLISPMAVPSAAALERDDLAVDFVLGWKSEYERDFDLDADDPEDMNAHEMTLRADVDYRPTEWLRAYLEIEAGVTFEDTEGEEEDVAEKLQVNQAYLSFSDLPSEDSELVFGRFLYRDWREWLIDENLDGARFVHEPGDLVIDVSVSRASLVRRDLLDEDTTGDQINNFVAIAEYELSEDLWLLGYGIYRDDRSDEGEEGRPFYFGLRSHGPLTDGLTHWLDLAAVRGTDGEEPLSGHAATGGLTYTFEDAPAAPRVTLGYAWASGDDDPDDGRNRNFRQTGMQSNEGRFGESAKFRYYGETFDPELSNMSILTAAIGASPAEGLSVDLVYNRYWQVEAADFLRDAAIDADPNGTSTDLGQEIDLVVGYEPNDTWETKFILGYFKPGDAFRSSSGDSADDAVYAQFEIDFRF